MKRVIVREFGGVDHLELIAEPTPAPGAGQVLVRLTCIGMNHADLMARRGEYRLSSGDPPFTPGIEGGGVIEAVGSGVTNRRVGQRVVLGLGVTGTYATHKIVAAKQAIPVADGVPDDHLGCLWLAYLTAWGCLMWKAELGLSQSVLISAASGAVAIAAAQVTRSFAGVSIGLTHSPKKVSKLRSYYDHVICTADADWPKQVKAATGGRGVSHAFDAIGAGDFLTQEIRLLSPGGTIWVYGLIGEVGPVNVHPLIIKRAAIRGWWINELERDEGVLHQACDDVLSRVAAGRWRLPIAGRFKLDDVRAAHEAMEESHHLGKLLLEP